VILQGSYWLIRPGTDPVPLGVGDVVFRPHGPGHTLADNPATRPTTPACPPDQPGVPQRYAVDTVGVPSDTGAGATVTVCGAYELDPALIHPLLDDLPELIHIPAHLGRHPAHRSPAALPPSCANHP
jgi:hypothetical protein